MKTASWVVINKETREAVFETFSETVADAINTQKYTALPIMEYLQAVNAAIRAECVETIRDYPTAHDAVRDAKEHIIEEIEAKGDLWTLTGFPIR